MFIFILFIAYDFVNTFSYIIAYQDKNKGSDQKNNMVSKSYLHGWVSNSSPKGRHT